MIVRIGLGAAGLALAANAIMIPSTVSLPGLTVDTINRHGEDNSNAGEESVEILPIHDDWLEKLKGLQLGVSQPLPAKDDVLYYRPDNGNEDSGDDGWLPVPAEYLDGDDDNLIPADFYTYDRQEDTPAGDWHDFSDVEVVGWYPNDDWVPSGEAAWIEIEMANNNDNDKHNDECPAGSSLEALFCRIRSMVSSKLDQVKPYFSQHRRPCPKKLAAMAKAKGEELKELKSHIKGGPSKFMPWAGDLAVDEHGGFYPSHHHAHGHGHGHEHHHHSKFSRFLRSICSGLRTFVTGFLIPIFIGVAAGMAASVLGMCIGTILAWIWIKFVRGGKRGNASARGVVVEEVEVVEGEKDGLLELDGKSMVSEAPPVYVERE